MTCFIMLKKGLREDDLIIQGEAPLYYPLIFILPCP